MSATTNEAFKPFLVQGGRDQRTIFKVLNLYEGISREMAEQLLERLPIGFQVRKDSRIHSEDLQEPLEVRFTQSIVEIYPMHNRIIACTSLDSWKSESIVRQMHVDNLMDTTCPGRGQVRSCIHFSPDILGVLGWPGDREIEIDIFVFPRTKPDEPQIKAPVFGKHELRDLLKLIMGSEDRLTAEKIRQWHVIIFYAVATMRACYENPNVPEDDPVRAYYKPHWDELDEAQGDSRKMVVALESLCTSIQME